MAADNLDQLIINTIRVLSVDAIQNANSGHPGAPMGMAPVAHVLFSQFLRFNPKNPRWLNRDRFVLSNGHGCMLQYSLLHLYGYDVSMDDVKAFRKLGSKLPGHPENNHTPGVEVTTGPLGQGISNAVGLAIAQAHAGAVFNKPGFDLINNYTYCFVGDGCLMEGVASEASSLAGHLRLGNLICIYDDNHVSIDGDIKAAFTEDVAKRYEAYGWHVVVVDNGDTDLEAIAAAFLEAQTVKDKPSLIKLRTTIGYGSLLQGTSVVHSNSLSLEDIRQLKTAFGFNPDERFAVAPAVYDACSARAQAGAKQNQAWEQQVGLYADAFPAEHAELQRRIAGNAPADWHTLLPSFSPSDPALTPRKVSATVLERLSPALPELMGGSADLTPSNLTRVGNSVDFQAGQDLGGSYAGTYIRYGVREHAMGAIMNGLAAYGARIAIPYSGTFLNFVSYAAPALRLAALSRLRVIWVATHDSVVYGEDGPTHQPIETLAHFRAIPNTMVWRPADGNETSAAWSAAIQAASSPSVLSLCRQDLPQLAGSSIAKASRGGYILQEAGSDATPAEADITLVATGSEVSLCVETARLLADKYGVRARVVSMPCCEVFDAQPPEYRLSVIPDKVPALSVEVLSVSGWHKYAHQHFGLDQFGASGPGAELYKKFDFTPEGVAKRALATTLFYKGATTLLSPLRLAF